MYKPTSIAKILFFTFLIFQQSCMYGGGSLGTGISGYDSGSTKTTDLKYLILGSIKDQSGKPLQGVSVTISLSEGNKNAISDSSGRFSSQIVTQSGNPIRFNFLRGALHVSCESLISPAGEDSVKINFVIKNSKEVVCP